MFEKHYRGENSLQPNAEEFRTPSVIAMLMFKGSIYAGAVFFAAPPPTSTVTSGLFFTVPIILAASET